MDEGGLSAQSALPYMVEAQLKKERGRMILQLYNESNLQHTGTVRGEAGKKARTEEWMRICEEVNKTFGESLGEISVERVKKLQMYYRNREEKFDEPEEKNMSVDHLLEDVLKEEDEEGANLGVKMEMENEMESPHINVDWENSQELDLDREMDGSMSTGMKLLELRSARADFVFDLANHYQQRLCFKDKPSSDRSIRFGRSSTMNAERLLMWKTITEKANKRFGDKLGLCDVEQIKKMYTNRVSRPKKNHIAAPAEELLASPRASVEPSPSPSIVSLPASSSSSSSKKRARQDMKTPDSSTPTPSVDRASLLLAQARTASAGPSGKMDSLLRAFDRSDEITNLKNQLVEKDMEIERLRRVIVELSDEHLRRMTSVMDMVKVALSEQTASDIAVALRMDGS